MPLLELVVDISPEITTTSVVNSGLCAEELLPAMCSLFFPPLRSSNMSLCQETCGQIFQDCDIALAFFRESTPSVCIDLPRRTDSGNFTCIEGELLFEIAEHFRVEIMSSLFTFEKVLTIAVCSIPV